MNKVGSIVEFLGSGEVGIILSVKVKKYKSFKNENITKLYNIFLVKDGETINTSKRFFNII